MAAFTPCHACDTASAAKQPLEHVTVELPSGATRLSGRAIVIAPDGNLLFEERSGRLHTIAAAAIRMREVTDSEFSPLSETELCSLLLQQHGGGFHLRTTEHFVICSNTSESFTDFCARLVERVVEEYFEFFSDSAVDVRRPSGHMAIVLFRNVEMLREFANQQHPETSFEDVPGYYSVDNNQTFGTGQLSATSETSTGNLVRELRRSPRQVETIVHEVIHQLCFNTGLQTRFADNPIWLSEGLAVYFEGASGRGSLVWSGPGHVNRIQLAHLRAAGGNQWKLPLQELLTSDEPFRSEKTVRDAYAESWALNYFLIRKHRSGFDDLLRTLQTRKPLIPVSADVRAREVTDATGLTMGEMERQLQQFVKRIRSPR